VRLLDVDVKKIGAMYTPEQFNDIEKRLDGWIAEFPAVYAVKNPDTQFDLDYHYVASQRYQLHMVAYMLKLDPVRAYLT
jgi:hypothetical protein